MDINNYSTYNTKRNTFKAISSIKATAEKTNSFFSRKTASDSAVLYTRLKPEAEEIKNELVKTKSQQGLIGKAWDGIKNTLKMKAGSNTVENAIKNLQNGKIKKEEAQEILAKYQDGQKTCLDVVADMVSGIIAVGAFSIAVPTGGTSLAIGLGLSTLLGAGIKTGIKGIDAKRHGREYNHKNLTYDLITGGINGIFAPVTNGLGSSLTKTIGCKLGLEVTGDLVEQGAKQTLKSLIVNQSIDVVGGSVGKRALALGAGMAIDGALGGTADNVTRAALEKQDAKGIAQAGLQGFLGGLIMAPVIGGGFRVAGKLGKKIGKKVSKNSLDIDNTPSKPSVKISKNYKKLFKQFIKDNPDLTKKLTKWDIKYITKSLNDNNYSHLKTVLEAAAINTDSPRIETHYIGFILKELNDDNITVLSKILNKKSVNPLDNNGYLFYGYEISGMIGSINSQNIEIIDPILDRAGTFASYSIEPILKSTGKENIDIVKQLITRKSPENGEYLIKLDVIRDHMSKLNSENSDFMRAIIDTERFDLITSWDFDNMFQNVNKNNLEAAIALLKAQDKTKQHKIGKYSLADILKHINDDNKDLIAPLVDIFSTQDIQSFYSNMFEYKITDTIKNNTQGMHLLRQIVDENKLGKRKFSTEDMSKMFFAASEDKKPLLDSLLKTPDLSEADITGLYSNSNKNTAGVLSLLTNTKQKGTISSKVMQQMKNNINHIANDTNAVLFLLEAQKKGRFDVIAKVFEALDEASPAGKSNFSGVLNISPSSDKYFTSTGPNLALLDLPKDKLDIKLDALKLILKNQGDNVYSPRVASKEVSELLEFADKDNYDIISYLLSQQAKNSYNKYIYDGNEIAKILKDAKPGSLETFKELLKLNNGSYSDEIPEILSSITTNNKDFILKHFTSKTKRPDHHFEDTKSGLKVLGQLFDSCKTKQEREFLETLSEMMGDNDTYRLTVQNIKNLVDLYKANPSAKNSSQIIELLNLKSIDGKNFRFTKLSLTENSSQINTANISSVLKMMNLDETDYRFNSLADVIELSNMLANPYVNHDTLKKILAMTATNGNKTEYRFNSISEIKSIQNLIENQNFDQSLLQRLLNIRDINNENDYLATNEVMSLLEKFNSENAILIPEYKVKLLPSETYSYSGLYNDYAATIHSNAKLLGKCVDKGNAIPSDMSFNEKINFLAYINSLRAKSPEDKDLINKLFVKHSGQTVNLDELASELITSIKKIEAKSFKEKLAAIKQFDEFTTWSAKEKELLGFDIDSYVNELRDLVNGSIKPVVRADAKAERAAQINLFKNVFANNRPDIDETLKNIDFSQFKALPDGIKPGLPLTYPREIFTKDLTLKLNTLKPAAKKDILGKLNITLTTSGKSYDGLLRISKLDLNNPDEKQIYDLVNKFLFENKINRTSLGNDKLADILDSLIGGFPEFVNTIGKQQHSTHQYSLDIHILKVLNECLKDEDYSKLSAVDKTKLKITAILHDIMKADNIIDNDHPEISALYARGILDKFTLAENLKDRIFELVKNHHWLKDYDPMMANVNPQAVKFRFYDDYTISKIMAASDLKGVNDSYFAKHGGKLSKESQQKLAEALKKLYGESNIIFTDEIVIDKLLAKIPVTEYKGNKYRILDFTKVKDGEDLSYMGFLPGTKKEDLRFNVHVNDSSPENLETIYALSRISNSGIISQSSISPKNKRTYYNRRFGLILSNQNNNIATATPYNQHSGYGKDFEQFIKLKTSEQENSHVGSYKKFRSFMPEKIMESLGITKDEYAELYRQIGSFNYKSQISDNELFNVGQHTLSGADIKKAIKNTQDLLLSQPYGYEHSEVVAFNSKPTGFMAKVDKIEDIPSNYLEFIRKRNLPIYLFGS